MTVFNSDISSVIFELKFYSLDLNSSSSDSFYSKND